MLASCILIGYNPKDRVPACNISQGFHVVPGFCSFCQDFFKDFFHISHSLDALFFDVREFLFHIFDPLRSILILFFLSRWQEQGISDGHPACAVFFKAGPSEKFKPIELIFAFVLKVVDEVDILPWVVLIPYVLSEVLADFTEIRPLVSAYKAVVLFVHL